MSISMGGINLVESAVNTELRVLVLEKLVERLVQATPGSITQSIVDDVRRQALEELQNKYPEAGISIKP